MQDFLDDFRETIEDAGKRLLSISEQQSQIPRSEGKWSPKEIIGHLIDSAANNHQRFVLAQFSDDLVFPGYSQEEWVRVQGYNQEPWQQLVQLWRHYNLHVLHLMSLAPEATRTKQRMKHNLDQIAWQSVAQKDSVTLEYFMRDYVAHLKNHLRQILSS
ncbi:MAG: DinB family protein [Pyrinomonadaceae bacterium]